MKGNFYEINRTFSCREDRPLNESMTFAVTDKEEWQVAGNAGQQLSIFPNPDL